MSTEHHWKVVFPPDILIDFAGNPRISGPATVAGLRLSVIRLPALFDQP